MPTPGRTSISISIHALREEGDDGELSPCKPVRVISIHALREEGDRRPRPAVRATRYFYPRPPRGGRRGRAMVTSLAANFYPRPPRGGRLARKP